MLPINLTSHCVYSFNPFAPAVNPRINAVKEKRGRSSTDSLLDLNF
jgi:hypothetical protein